MCIKAATFRLTTLEPFKHFMWKCTCKASTVKALCSKANSSHSSVGKLVRSLHVTAVQRDSLLSCRRVLVADIMAIEMVSYFKPNKNVSIQWTVWKNNTSHYKVCLNINNLCRGLKIKLNISWLQGKTHYGVNKCKPGLAYHFFFSPAL